jgi:hypothetical protein
MVFKTLVAASLTSMVLTTAAFAQCADCAMYPDRDHLNGGVQTPAAKMGVVRPSGTAPAANNASNASNAHAQIRGHQLQGSGAPEMASTAIRSKKYLRSRESGPR